MEASGLPPRRQCAEYVLNRPGAVSARYVLGLKWTPLRLASAICEFPVLSTRSCARLLSGGARRGPARRITSSCRCTATTCWASPFSSAASFGHALQTGWSEAIRLSCHQALLGGDIQGYGPQRRTDIPWAQPGNHHRPLCAVCGPVWKSGWNLGGIGPEPDRLCGREPAGKSNAPRGSSS